MTAPRIGLALGGGGARGLAHISMLEALDELGLTPHRIAGTSIGAIIGMGYAAGLAAEDLRRELGHFIDDNKHGLRSIFGGAELLQWLKLADFELGRGALIKGDLFQSHLQRTLGVKRFEDLKIPLKIVATDFWLWSQVVFDTGLLRPAVQSSMAIPGVFSPVQHMGRILVDGGPVNPVPYDILADECDLTIAIDVAGIQQQPRSGTPNIATAIFTTFQIMQHSILNEKIKHRPPDILIRPEIEDVKALEFFKAAAIREQAEPAKDQLKRELEAILEPRHRGKYDRSY